MNTQTQTKSSLASRNPAILSLLLVTSLAFSQPTLAAETNSDEHTRSAKPELIGMGSGAVIGAIVGGPVGAFIGGFTGTFIGKSVNDEDQLAQQNDQIQNQTEQLEQQQLALNEQRQGYQSLMDQHQQLEHQLLSFQQAQQDKLDELAIGMNVHFKTGSSEIEPHFQKQLDDVVYAMNIADELQLDLSGYADRRGDSEFNRALSEQRLIAVRQYLTERGIHPTRLHGKAFGDSQPLAQQESLEDNFFDRRVTLKLQAPQDGMTAKF